MNFTRLGLLFALAVIVPSVALAVLAARAIRREEAYIEKRLADALSAEVQYLVTRVGEELESIRGELEATAPTPSTSGQGLEAWRNGSPLVGVPFLLSASFELIRPAAERELGAQERTFLRSNEELLSNRADIPVYQNIALAYQDEALGAAAGPAGEQPAAEVQQQAVSAFERDEAVREKLYAEAEQKGQKPLERTVQPRTEKAAKQASPAPSVFVAEPRRLEAITLGKDSGLIPRFTEDRLDLLFWKRLADGRIVGCQLDPESLRGRLAAALPQAYTRERILTLLDEQGVPLFAPQEDAARDYRRPFVAREVSELLPRWEAAAYLTDPSAVSYRARLAGGILWALIAILSVSILSGGTLVLRGLRSEIELARKKASFVAGVSHELKTPLTSIRMYAEMLKQGRQPDKAKQRQYLGIMVDEAQRLTRLVNNVLDFSQLEQGKRRYTMKELDPERLCRDILEAERPRLEQAGFAVSFAAPPPGSAAPVRGDEEALKQALLNLLSNAEKYSGERKEIRVELERSPKRVHIRVLDRGRGIAPGQAGHLFKEFYRADDALTSPVKGTGLGLAIARRIVNGHGGEIRYAPREGGGSVFQVELPASGEPAHG